MLVLFVWAPLKPENATMAMIKTIVSHQVSAALQTNPSCTSTDTFVEYVPCNSFFLFTTLYRAQVCPSFRVRDDWHFECTCQASRSFGVALEKVEMAESKTGLRLVRFSDQCVALKLWEAFLIVALVLAAYFTWSIWYCRWKLGRTGQWKPLKSLFDWCLSLGVRLHAILTKHSFDIKVHISSWRFRLKQRSM